MGEQDTVVALIDRIVAGAHIPGRAAREDLRRELWTHFEEAGTSPEAIDQALRRFGAASTAAALYANHLLLSVAFGASRALLASAVLVAVWFSTVRILGRIEHAFVGFLEPSR